jgi:putative PIN family toxin of toxin-antitoxin system
VIRAVLDTNVLVSALITPSGPPRRILTAWRRREFELLTCLPLLRELNRVLHYPRLQGKYNLREADIFAYLGLLRVRGTIVAIPDEIPPMCSDPTDDKLLACALVAQASYVVTGNRHVLILDQVGPAQIVTPSTFATMVLGGQQPPFPDTGDLR